jgi:hypothetical protein
MIHKRTLTTGKDHIVEQAKKKERGREIGKRAIIVIFSMRTKTVMVMYT